MYKTETIKNYVNRITCRMEEYQAMYNAGQALRACISAGNVKIGRVLNVSLPAVIACRNCSECKGICYEIKAGRYTNVIDARAKNMALVNADRDEFFSQIENRISRRRKNKFFRWHVAGDILDLDYFSRMVETARRHPDFVFWTYTKMYGIVNIYCRANGRDAIPDNFSIMFSEWDGMPMNNPYNFPVFSCKLAAGNKNHPAEYFDGLYKCPGNCDICKAIHRGCLAGENTYADEH